MFKRRNCWRTVFKSQNSEILLRVPAISAYHRG